MTQLTDEQNMLRKWLLKQKCEGCGQEGRFEVGGDVRYTAPLLYRVTCTRCKKVRDAHGLGVTLIDWDAGVMTIPLPKWRGAR